MYGGIRGHWNGGLYDKLKKLFRKENYIYSIAVVEVGEICMLLDVFNDEEL